MNKALFWGGVLVVGWWLMKNKMPAPSTNDLGFGSNPVDDNINQMESANFWSKFMQGTPAVAPPAGPRMPSDTPEQIRNRVLYGSGL